MHVKLRELEEYAEDRFLLKGVYKGAQSEAVLLHLKPGQEMPSHPHDRFEVALLPQTGSGMLTMNGTRKVRLEPGSLYHEPAGCTFGIVNDGEAPLQVLITLIRVEADAGTDGN